MVNEVEEKAWNITYHKYFHKQWFPPINWINYSSVDSREVKPQWKGSDETTPTRGQQTLHEETQARSSSDCWSYTSVSFQALQEAGCAYHIFVWSRNASRCVLYTMELRGRKIPVLYWLLYQWPFYNHDEMQKSTEENFIVCLWFQRVQPMMVWPHVFETVCDRREYVSHGGQGTEGIQEEARETYTPKNMPYGDPLPPGRPHLLNFLQPPKIMPPSRYLKFHTSL